MEYEPGQMSLAYPAEAYQMPPDGSTVELGRMPTTPLGFSGGGVWKAANPAGAFFDPRRHIQLLGVETHWSPCTRRLRCVPCGVIVEALREFRPGLLDS